VHKVLSLFTVKFDSNHCEVQPNDNHTIVAIHHNYAGFIESGFVYGAFAGTTAQDAI
jgi:hypothetical protein